MGKLRERNIRLLTPFNILNYTVMSLMFGLFVGFGIAQFQRHRLNMVKQRLSNIKTNLELLKKQEAEVRDTYNTVILKRVRQVLDRDITTKCFSIPSRPRDYILQRIKRYEDQGIDTLNERNLKNYYDLKNQLRELDLAETIDVKVADGLTSKFLSTPNGIRIASGRSGYLNYTDGIQESEDHKSITFEYSRTFTAADKCWLLLPKQIGLNDRTE